MQWIVKESDGTLTGYDKRPTLKDDKYPEGRPLGKEKPGMKLFRRETV